MDINDLPQNFRQIIYPGRVVDNVDPLNLGRIRVYPEQQNTQNKERSIEGFDENSPTPEKNGPWSPKDPFIFLPLLPYFINPVPRVNEYVHIIYSNPSKLEGPNKFYIQGPFSSPTTTNLENIESAKTNLTAGVRNKPFQNLKDAKTKEYNNKKNQGVYPEPGDNALVGRGTSDVIVKENSTLLRAGRNKKYKRGQIPEVDPSRAFVQLSKFDTSKSFGTPEKITKIVKQNKFVKLLVEYDILNPENTQNAFTGSIYLYGLKELPETNTENLDFKTDLENAKTQFITFQNFQAKTIPQVIKLINDFISGVFKGNLKNVGGTNTDSNNGRDLLVSNRFPFYFRPTNRFLSYVTEYGNLNQTNILSITNISAVMNSVKLFETDLTPGYGLVYDSSGKSQVPFKKEVEILIPEQVNQIDETVNIIGANTLYLLSHRTTIPGKRKITLGDETVYGIDIDTIQDLIEPNTSSMVRGEELLELINLIVKFLITHVHPYPGMPPVPVSQDGTKADDILKQILEANQTILNQYIKLN